MKNYDVQIVDGLMGQMVLTIYERSIWFLSRVLCVPDKTMEGFVEYISTAMKNQIPIIDTDENHDIIFRVYDGVFITKDNPGYIEYIEDEYDDDDDESEEDYQPTDSTPKDITDIFMESMDDDYCYIGAFLRFTGFVIPKYQIVNEFSKYVKSLLYYNNDSSILDLYFSVLSIKLLNIFCDVVSLALSSIRIVTNSQVTSVDIDAEKCRLSLILTEIYSSFRQYMGETTGNTIKVAINHKYEDVTGDKALSMGITNQDNYYIEHYWIY